MADNDDATNELIARMLAADNDQYGYDDPGAGDLSDDSDYGEPSRKRARKGKTRQPALTRPEKEKPPAAAATPGDADDFTSSGRRKRRDTGAKREGAAKGWTPDEERLFLEGLELFGREWHKAATHVGTRDKKAFTSHAQKHFIKLCIADKPLPQKVVETGAGSGLGYTLSGLPLDPNSASARSYGFKPEHLERLLVSGGPGAKGLLLPGKENQNSENTAARDDPPAGQQGNAPAAVDPSVAKPANPSSAAPGEGSQHQAPPPKAVQRKPKARMPSTAVAIPQESPEAQPPHEPTEYMKNRPRREGAGTRSRLGSTTESLELVRCSEFIGPPGSGASLAQPFEVAVDRQADLVMDFHAHLSGCEIIGLLGGVWEPTARRIAVRAAFPCARLAGSHSGTSVEVDPQAQVAALQEMERRGLTSVGWYHSHPIFSPTPSQKDNENQRNQQVMHRCGQTGLEPCLGAIVGPYDTTNPSEAAVTSWFVVQSRGSQLVPFRVRLTGEPAPPQLPDTQLETALRAVIDATANDPDRIDLTKEWRPFRLLIDGQPHGGRLTNLSKMRLSVARHLRGTGADAEAAAAFLDRVFGHLKETWGVLQATPAAQQADEPDGNIAGAAAPCEGDGEIAAGMSAKPEATEDAGGEISDQNADDPATKTESVQGLDGHTDPLPAAAGR